jgi:hypothetical protein
MKRKIQTIKFLQQELNTLSISGTVVIGQPKLRVQYSVTAETGEQEAPKAFGAAMFQTEGYNGTIELEKANLPELTDEAILYAVAQELKIEISK